MQSEIRPPKIPKPPWINDCQTHQTLARLTPIDPFLATAELHMRQLGMPTRLLRIALRTANVPLTGRPASVRRAIAGARLARYDALSTRAHATGIVWRIELHAIRYDSFLVNDTTLPMAQRFGGRTVALKVSDGIGALRRRNARMILLAAALVNVDAWCTGCDTFVARPTGARIAMQLVLASLIGETGMLAGGAFVQVLLARWAIEEGRTRTDAGRHTATAIYTGLRTDSCMCVFKCISPFTLSTLFGKTISSIYSRLHDPIALALPPSACVVAVRFIPVSS